MEENADDIVLVTVATFPEAIEAHIYRNRLEVEGIPCVIGDENVVSNQPWHSIAYGGVKLRVRAIDKEAALALIAEIRATGQTEKEVCPVCGSDKIKLKRNVNPLNKVLSVLFGLPAKQNKVMCFNCGHEWQIS